MNKKEQLRTMSNQLVQAIHDYKQEQDFDELELESIIDNLLCRLPRDIIYVEWFDRSDIENIADIVCGEPATKEFVDACMHDLDNFNGSFIDNESIQLVVEETLKQQKGN